MAERLGDELEGEDVYPALPTNPGKGGGGGRLSERAKFLLFLVAVIAVAGIFVYVLATNARPRPTPDEFCAGHGGVRYLSAGGWATADTATCEDGHAGEVYP